MEFLSRLLFTAAIIGAGILLYRLVNSRVLRGVRTKTEGLAGFKPGTPAVLYFTTEDCMPCKTVQRPALKQLVRQAGKGRVQIIQVDAIERADLADYWGVLSVPTTFVIDSHGRPRRVNHGVTRAEALFDQIQAVEQERELELSQGSA